VSWYQYITTTFAAWCEIVYFGRKKPINDVNFHVDFLFRGIGIWQSVYSIQEMISGESTMAIATYNNTTIADSDQTVIVEGNHYFPLGAVNRALLKSNSRQTVCPWKGTANYYDVVVDGKTAKAAAWYYANPKPAASAIKDHIAFWGDVTVQ
jgi:uncharacterized protein (DUF427 family)